MSGSATLGERLCCLSLLYWLNTFSLGLDLTS